MRHLPSTFNFLPQSTPNTTAIMDMDKLKKMQHGKGTPRRKVKSKPKNSGVDDKKLQTALKKINVQPIQAIEEVNMFKADGNVIHFAAPKVHAAVPSNTFAIYGNGEDKELTELVPGILNQLGPDSLASLRKLAESYQSMQKKEGEEKEDDDDIPDLVAGETFDEKVDVESPTPPFVMMLSTTPIHDALVHSMNQSSENASSTTAYSSAASFFEGTDEQTCLIEGMRRMEIRISNAKGLDAVRAATSFIAAPFGKNVESSTHTDWTFTAENYHKLLKTLHTRNEDIKSLRITNKGLLQRDIGSGGEYLGSGGAPLGFGGEHRESE
ncbi:hypothetical protein V502_07997 [Pseudogymnoascus sp. VKM F-4520 (FW-2644)]|nr:hypothetical protein V502_07997 [Pseudogymnoascus sp. VKM F-4520 (FW-2644)]